MVFETNKRVPVKTRFEEISSQFVELGDVIVSVLTVAYRRFSFSIS